MSAGWIRLYRALLKDPVWTTATPEQKAVLMVILLSASHEQRQWVWEGRKFAIEPGQFMTSLSSLAASAGVSVQNVRSAIARFEKLNFLTNVSTKTGRLISVVNWATYQGIGMPVNKETSKDPTKTQQLSRMKEGKKKEKTSSSDALRLSGLLAELIADNNPQNRTVQSKVREKSIKRWAADIDRMLRLDGRHPHEVEEIIRWSQEDGFWCGNILSGSKLRQQFDKLTLAMQRDGQNGRASREAASMARRVF